MHRLAEFLRRHLWAAFLAHQALILLVAIGFLTSVRRFTGRDIHGGRDPIGLIDGATLVVLSVAVVVLSKLFYHWVKGADAAPLGIALSARRCIQLFVGLLFGFALTIAPFVSGVLLGTASVHESVSCHFGNLTVVRFLVVGFLLLLVQGIMEETANRAFPMRLWQHRSLAFAVLVPSFFFAIIHLANEEFSLERIAILLMAGVVQSFAYALTGNIWFTSGLHTGANYALFSISGLWHAGAVVSVVGRPSFPNWVGILLLLIVLAAIVLITRRTRGRSYSRINRNQ